MMRRIQKTIIVATIAAAVASPAVSVRSQEPERSSAAASRGLIQDRSYASPAEALFVEKCSMCHRRMGMGTVLLARRMDPELAELEKRDDLTAAFVKIVARQGMGNMPPIPPGEVSDAQLNLIADYLATENGQ